LLLPWSFPLKQTQVPFFRSSTVPVHRSWAPCLKGGQAPGRCHSGLRSHKSKSRNSCNWIAFNLKVNYSHFFNKHTHTRTCQQDTVLSAEDRLLLNCVNSKSSQRSTSSVLRAFLLMIKTPYAMHLQEFLIANQHHTDALAQQAAAQTHPRTSHLPTTWHWHPEKTPKQCAGHRRSVQKSDTLARMTCQQN